MLALIFGIIIRIFSNSYLNVYQKLLTKNGEHSSIVNFYTYLGLALIGFLICKNPIFSIEILPYILTMGFLGAIGNYFIIKALSCGELSALAPINSYKPIVALITGFLLLKEIPGMVELFGILLILFGTLILVKAKIFFTKSTLYRFIALFLLGTEAVFIKKVVQLTDVSSAFFYWVLTGFVFATIFALTSKHGFTLNKSNFKPQIYLIFMVAIMQYTTNYVFSKINVAYALALFQLSTIVSIFLGASVFNEKDLLKKIFASIIMLVGASFIIFA